MTVTLRIVLLGFVALLLAGPIVRLVWSISRTLLGGR